MWSCRTHDPATFPIEGPQAQSQVHWSTRRTEHSSMIAMPVAQINYSRGFREKSAKKHKGNQKETRCKLLRVRVPTPPPPVQRLATGLQRWIKAQVKLPLLGRLVGDPSHPWPNTYPNPRLPEGKHLFSNNHTVHTMYPIFSTMNGPLQ